MGIISKSFRWAAFLMLTYTGNVYAAQKTDGIFPFKDGDIVGVIGDSITEHAYYVNFMELWTVTRFPTANIRFRNVGKGSDTAPGGASRFQACVVPIQPTVLTVDYGMNDASYRAFDTKIFETYKAGLQNIANQAKAMNTRVIWITPQPVEPSAENKKLGDYVEYNVTLSEFAKRLKPFAEANNGLYIDQFHPYLAVLEKARVDDPLRRINGGDWIHPSPPGGALMASIILKAMSFPSLVSLAEIDAGSLKSTITRQCEITELKADPNGGLQFRRLDAALPYFPDPVVGKKSPAQPSASAILQWAPILEDLNKYMLKVAGLKPGPYEIKLNGEKVAVYSDAQLAQGVNLAGPALEKGPIANQVREVINAVTAKNLYFHDKIFRGIMDYRVSAPPFVKNPKPILADIEKQKAISLVKRLEEMPKYDEAIRKTLELKSHLVEITPVADKELK